MIEFLRKHKTWIAFVVILASATSALYWIERANQEVRREARERFFEQYNRQQDLVAEMASRSLGELFGTFDRELDLLGSLFEGREVTRERVREMGGSLKKIFASLAANPVFELVVYNKKGVVVGMEPYDSYTLGRSYAWRNYYRWARDNKDPAAVFVSPFMLMEGGLHRGEKELIVAKGIYGSRGEFRGVVTCVVDFDSLARKYVMPVHIGKQGHAWLVDSDTKTVLVDPNGRIGGKSFDEALFRKWPRLYRILESTENGKPGDGWYEYEDPNDPSRSVRKLVSYHPVRLGHRLWTLGVATPEREVEALLSPLLERQQAISTSLLVTIVGGASLLLAILFNWTRALSVQVWVKTRALSEAHSRLESAFNELLMTKKVAAVGHLALGLAHEIRNPLSSIQMNMQMIRKRIEPSGLLSENFSIVDGEIRRLNNLLSDVLDFARPRQLRLQPVELSETVERLLQFLSQRLAEQRIRVETHLQVPLNLVCDPEQIQQVLLNLVLNAMEAMGENGADAERRLDITTLTSERQAVFQVKDSGPGIPEEKREHLFDPFYTTKTSGGGLGLSILQTIVLSHGGTVAVESEPGRGTTFIVALPLDGPPEKEADAWKQS